MEKGRSLRLKRKVSSKSISHSTKILKASHDKHADNPIEKVQAIVLSSDSDEEFQLMTDQPKQRNEDSNTRVADCSNNAGKKDSSLHKLKQLIFNLSSKECLDPASLTPFPTHPQVLKDANSVVGKDKTDFKWRLQILPKSKVSEELSPFPKPCDKCRKMDICKKIIPCDNSGVNGLESITDSTVECAVKAHEELKFANSSDLDRDHQNVGPDQRSTLFNTQNLCLNGSLHKNTNVASGQHNTSSSCLISNRRVDHSTTTPSSAKLSAVNVQTSVSRQSTDSNNSHLMRDRNSNLYSLQSRNNPILPQSMGHNSVSEKPETDYVPCSSSAAEFQTGPCDISVEKLEPSNNSNNTKTLKPTLNTPGYNMQGTSGTLNRNQALNNVTVSNSSNKTTVPNSLEDNKEGRKNPVNMTGSVFPRVRKDNEETATGNKTGDKREPVLQSCPMCQMKFAEGTTQIQIDSHLASCLSTADDDFSW